MNNKYIVNYDYDMVRELSVHIDPITVEYVYRTSFRDPIPVKKINDKVKMGETDDFIFYRARPLNGHKRMYAVQKKENAVLDGYFYDITIRESKD